MAQDDKFKKLKKAFYHFLKAHHHLTNIRISDGTTKEPPGMVRTMRSLESVIKPANPNPTSQLMLYGNARNWLHNSLQILEDHYEKTIRDSEIIIKQLAGEEDWKTALTIAINWTKKDVKKVKEDTIVLASKKITELLQGCGVLNPASERNTVPGGTEHLKTKKRPQTTGQTAKSAKKSRGDEHDLVEEGTFENPEPGTEFSSPQTKKVHQREVMPNLEPTGPKEIDGFFFEEDFPPLPAPQGPPLTFQTFLTSKQGPRPLTTKNPCAIENMAMEIEPYPFSGTVTKKTPHQEPHRSPKRMVLIHQPLPESPGQFSKFPFPPIEEEDCIIIPDEVPNLVEEEDRIIIPDKVPNLLVEEQGRNLFHIAMGTPPTAFKPTRHLNTKRKMVDWCLVAKRKWLIMGDSNLSRIPSFQTPDMQIESYPGATFLHAEVLMKKTKMMIKVEKVVLSFGINNKNQKLKETAIKQLQRAVKAAKETFPYAEIWVPQINFCKNLPGDQQLTLNNLNAYIGKNMGHIPLLPDEVFSVNRDLVHWTTDTAKAMLEHWMKYLNCLTP